LDRQPEGPIFADRLEAGRQLGEELRLRGYADEPALVIAIPRGGVPVGHAVAQAIGAPLALIIPRKLPIPDNPETSFGAITPDGTMVLNLPQLEEKQLSVDVIKRVALETLSEVRRQMETYYAEPLPLDLTDKVAVLVDDGLGSGFTMLAAVRALHRHKPARVVVAVPVSTFSSADQLSSQVDELVCLVERDDATFSVASYYEDSDDLTDEQVRALLQNSHSDAQALD
jgi:putative phosphoribosyl transferase